MTRVARRLFCEDCGMALRLRFATIDRRASRDPATGLRRRRWVRTCPMAWVGIGDEPAVTLEGRTWHTVRVIRSVRGQSEARLRVAARVAARERLGRRL